MLTTNPEYRHKQTPDKIWVSYSRLQSAVRPDSQILLDDGAVELRVLKCLPAEGAASHSEGDVLCRIMNSGLLGNKKGVNLPGEKVELPAMCEKDKEDIR